MVGEERWLNQLEPDNLFDLFSKFPPEGFQSLALRQRTDPTGQGRSPLDISTFAKESAASAPLEPDCRSIPAFAASFDLLTTADADFKNRLGRLPGFAYWARFLKVRTAFVGTTVSEYALLPANGSPDALARDVRQNLGRAYPLLIVKDLPQDSPLLSASENQYAAEVLAACEQHGFVLLEGQALAYVSINFSSIEEYLARLDVKARKYLRRKFKARNQLTVRKLETGNAFLDEALVDAYYALYAGVYAQSEVHFDHLTRSFFASVLRDGTSGGIVFEYRRAEDNALVGWNLCFEYRGNLVDKYIGLAYPMSRELNLYFVSWVVNLEHAIERGLRHYVAGWTDPEIKALLGASFTFTRHAVYVRNPLLRRLARKFAGRFESDRQWSDSRSEVS